MNRCVFATLRCSDQGKPDESHTSKEGQPLKRATNPGTWTEPAQAPVLPSMKQVAAERRSVWEALYRRWGTSDHVDMDGLGKE